MQNKFYRIIDANLNRSREGLRVIEDIVRFCIDDKRLTSTLKKIRHELSGTVRDTGLLLSSRNSKHDVGRGFNPLLEGTKKDIVISNFRRVEESLRVLEEVSKILMPQKARIYKKLRFRVYNMEKRVYEVVCNIR